MPRGSSYKARRNEIKYPYIAELPASMRGLDAALSRRIMQFHKTRHVQPRQQNVINAMAHAGYGIFDIHDLNASPKYGVLWLRELAFLRNGSHLLDGVDKYE